MLSSEELIKLYKQGDNSAFDKISSRYISIINSYCRKLFLLGGDIDDLVQEGLVGLSKAVNTYNSDKGAFHPYALLCIKTNIYTAIKKYSNLKNKPLNESDSLETLDNKLIFCNNPEETLLENELKDELKKKIYSKLSNNEILVLTLYLDGFSYSEIGNKLGKNVKSVDNSLQRIRKKIVDCLGE